MEEHREAVAGPNMVEASVSTQSMVQKSQPVISKLN